MLFRSPSFWKRAQTVHPVAGTPGAVSVQNESLEKEPTGISGDAAKGRESHQSTIGSSSIGPVMPARIAVSKPNPDSMSGKARKL